MAAKRVAERHGTADLVLLFADVGEHGDNYRFLREAAEWIGGELVVIDNGGRTIWQVFHHERFLGNSRIDPCSKYLKRKPMRAWLEANRDPADTAVYLGFDWTEEHRFVKASRYWDPWRVECPLMWDPILDKAEGMEAMRAAGVEPPLLTRLGFPHANCHGGCVKAGAKQFRKLLETFPDEYARWEWNEEALRARLGNVAILRDRRGGTSRPLPLRELRIRIEAEGRPDLGGAEEEWGACNCFTPVEEDDA